MKYSKLYIILFTGILLLIPGNKSTGCVESFSDESDWLSLYMPDISGAETLMPFYLSTYGYYREPSRWPDLKARKQNDKEWWQYLDKNVNPLAIDTFLYDADPLKTVNCIDSISKGKRNDSEYIYHNGLIQFVFQTKNEAVINYLRFAKSVEYFLVIGDPWDQRLTPNIEKLKEMGAKGLVLYKTCTDQFLKMRYAYQCIKIYGNMARKDNPEARKICSDLYDSSFEKNHTNSTLKYWALFFKALSIPGNPVKTNYLLSKVFDSTDEKELDVVGIFDNKLVNETMAFAKSNHDKAAILTISAIRNPGPILPILEKIYHLDPENNKLGMLLSREINKLEQWIIIHPIKRIGAEYDALYRKNVRKDLKYLDRVLAFTTLAANNHNTKEPGLWQVASGYLSFMRGQNSNANEWYTKAEKESNTENITLQLHLSKILTSIASADSITPAIENTINDGIDWMNRHKTKFTYGYHKNLYLYLAKKYEKCRHIGKAALMLFKANYCAYEGDIFPLTGFYTNEDDAYGYLYKYAGLGDLNEIIDLIKKKNKNLFEKFLIGKPLTINPDQDWIPDFKQLNLSLIMDMKGTWYVRHNMLNEALAVFEKIPDTLWTSEPYKTYLAANPFYLNRWQPHARHKADSIKYTKSSLIKRILKLQTEIGNGTGNVSRNNFLVGNAYYNMTYYGNYWMMTAYHSTIHDLYENTDIPKTTLNDNYYGCRLALNYYLKAAETAKDSRFKALCLIMAERCSMNYNTYIIASSPGLSMISRLKPVGHPFTKNFKGYYRMKEYKDLQQCDTYVDYIADLY